VTPVSDGRVCVVPGYEADYAYVATAFIESIRRGLGLCGLASDSPAGRVLAGQVCTTLYQLAGSTGLTRVPRDLAAHERFRDAYDQRLRERPPSPRVRRMAQEIAHRIVPFTAFMSGSTAAAHVARHIDPETRQFLFPDGEVPEELERRRQEWHRRQKRQRTLADIRGKSQARQALALLAAPTVLGEIGMWRGQPAVATVLSRGPNRLEVLVIDTERFQSLKNEPGFRAATAAEVQRRLSLNTSLTGTQLEDAAARSGDLRLASIAQLFRYLTGDSHVALDAVIDLPEDATPVECVEALRRQVDAAIAAGGLAPDLVRYLQQVVATIG